VKKGRISTTTRTKSTICGAFEPPGRAGQAALHLFAALRRIVTARRAPAIPAPFLRHSCAIPAPSCVIPARFLRQTRNAAIPSVPVCLERSAAPFDPLAEPDKMRVFVLLMRKGFQLTFREETVGKGSTFRRERRRSSRINQSGCCNLTQQGCELMVRVPFICCSVVLPFCREESTNGG